MFVRYRLGYLTLFALAAFELALSLGFGVAPLAGVLPGPSFFIRMLPAWVILPLLWAGYLSIEMARRRVDRPFVAVRRMLHHHRHWLLRGIVFLGMLKLLGSGFTSFKSAIPSYVPFYADPWLAELDRIIFGVDAWRLTHAVIGPIGTQIIDRVYALWFVIMMLYLGWFCFSRNQALQLRGLLSHLLCWGLLGNFAALSMSSVGPCFYEHFYGDAQFAPMMASLEARQGEYGLFATRAMTYLVNAVGKDRFGAGISAMPSLHVAVAFLCFLVAWEYGRHWWAKLLGFLFFAVIAVGSVHLGWHYAVDGIFSIIATGLIWWGTGRFTVWLEAREAAQAAAAVEPSGAPAPA